MLEKLLERNRFPFTPDAVHAELNAQPKPDSFRNCLFVHQYTNLIYNDTNIWGSVIWKVLNSSEGPTESERVKKKKPFTAQ